MGHDVAFVCMVQGHVGHTTLEDRAFDTSAMGKRLMRQLHAAKLDEGETLYSSKRGGLQHLHY